MHHDHNGSIRSTLSWLVISDEGFDHYITNEMLDDIIMPLHSASIFVKTGKIWMNGVLCAHTGWLGQENLLRMVRWNEMTLPSRYRILNLNPTGLRLRPLPLSVTEAPHDIESSRVSRKCFFETCMSERGSNPQCSTFQAGNVNHCIRATALAGSIYTTHY